MRQSVVGIEPERLIKQRERAFRLLGHVRRDERQRAEIRGVGIEAARARARRTRDLRPLQPRLKQACDLIGDPNLQIENIVRPRVAWRRPRRLYFPSSVVPADGIASPRSPPAAVRASRASAGSDFEPVRFMIEARWFSTVR